jgi:DNA-binding MarR family transcriptional regulator
MKDSNVDINESFMLEDFIPYRLAVLAKLVSTAFSKTYANRFGISIPQWRVMAAIGREPNCTASSIVEYAAMDKVQVSRAVSALVKIDYLERHIDRKDKRNSILHFTIEGREIYDKIIPAGRAFEKKLMSVMSPEDLREFDKLLKKLASQTKQL